MPFLGAYRLTFEAAPPASFFFKPGAIFLPVAREPCSLTLKTAPGAVFWEPRAAFGAASHDYIKHE